VIVRVLLGELKTMGSSWAPASYGPNPAWG